MAEVLNRREKILSESLPPKILTVDEIEEQLDTDGYAKVTDIPTVPTISEIEEQLDEDGYAKLEDIPAGGITLTPIGELDSPLTGAGTKDITCTEEIGSHKALMIYCTNNDDQGATTFIPVTDFIANSVYTLVAVSASGGLNNGYIKMKTGDTTGKVVTLEAKASTKFKTLKIYGVN